jgi:hypothetical protein
MAASPQVDECLQRTRWQTRCWYVPYHSSCTVEYILSLYDVSGGLAIAKASLLHSSTSIFPMLTQRLLRGHGRGENQHKRTRATGQHDLE